jgi:hypothetical protein
LRKLFVERLAVERGLQQLVEGREMLSAFLVPALGPVGDVS